MFRDNVRYLYPEGGEGGEGGEDEVQMIIIEGKEYTLDEIKSSMMMQSDYTKKSKELAETRKMVENAMEGVKSVVSIIKLAEDDPDEAVDQFKKLIRHTERRVDEGDKRAGKDLVMLERKLEEMQEDIAYRDAVNNMKTDVKYGSVFADYQDDIEDYALKHKIGSLRAATIAWREDNPDKVKVKEDKGKRVDADTERHQSGGGGKGEGFKISPEHIRRGDINAAMKEYLKSK